MGAIHEYRDVQQDARAVAVSDLAGRFPRDLANPVDGRHRRPPLRPCAERYRAAFHHARGDRRARMARGRDALSRLYIIGAVPAVAVGLLMAMFKPVRIMVDPL